MVQPELGRAAGPALRAAHHPVAQAANAVQAAVPLIISLRATGDPQHIDDLCRASGLPIARVSGALAMMELKGMVSLVGPMTYALPR